MSSRFYWSARCTSTTEYPPPKFILTGRSIARTAATMRERTNGKKTSWRSEAITGQEGVWRVADEFFINGGESDSHSKQ